jgi:hypothetical protein
LFRQPALALLVALAACDGLSGERIGRRGVALIGGALEGGDPGVVALLAAASSEVACSGTMVSPRVVVTAAHCLDSRQSITAYFGAHAYQEGIRISASRTAPHPGWTGDLQGNYDIGLVLLGFPVDPSWAVPLSLEPLTDDDVDRPVRRVGFGRHDIASEKPDGAKRAGATAITYVSVSMDWFFAGDEELIPCGGDSGGPVLAVPEGEEEERLIGVHSFGFGCESPSAGATRVDLHAADFVLPWIAENDPSCGADNLCARVGCPDDPDCQPCGPDGACTADCERPDLDCRTQAVGEICQADSQCESGLCVYWPGDPTAHFCSRPCGTDADCPSGMSCQPVGSLGRICYYDGDPPGLLGSDCESHAACGSYVCANGTCVTPCESTTGDGCPADFECDSRGEDATYSCYAYPGGGSCRVSAAGPGSGLAGLVLLVTVLCAARARRRR